MKRLLPILFALLAACGEGPPAPSSAASGGGAQAGVQITGNVAQGKGRLLVFVYVNLPPDVTPAAAEPTSVAGVALDRRFALGEVPPGNVTVLVLVDNGNDGAIDPGDPIALLNDPEHRLSGLQAGDQVTIRDLAVDAANGRATAASIDVKRTQVAAAAVAPTSGAPATAPAPPGTPQ